MGVITAVDYERAYTDDAQSVCHVLGYVGRSRLSSTMSCGAWAIRPMRWSARRVSN